MSGMVDLHIDGLCFDGFSQQFADRAGVALYDGLHRGLTNIGDAQGTDLTALSLGALVLDNLDYSGPEQLGQSLANAILAEVAR